MEKYNQKLEEQLKQLKALIKKSNNNVARYRNLPDGQIHISNCRGCIQYYFVEKEKGTKRYIGVKEEKTIKKYIQRDYDIAVNKKLKELHKRLQKFIKFYDINQITDIYDDLHYGRKKYVEPIVKPYEKLADEWKAEHPGLQNPYPEEGMYKTNRGEMVRSKSEKIIADALDKNNIAYQYEPLLELGYNTVYPDFIILNPKTRKSVYWEHLGIVSDADYAVKNFKKLLAYDKNGYSLYKDLIITMESKDMPLDIRSVEEKINDYFL